MAFSSGEDALGWFMTWCGFYDSLRQLDKPCVIALNGVAAGSVPPMYSWSRWISLRTWLHSGRIRGGITQLPSDTTAVIGCCIWVKRAFILPILQPCQYPRRLPVPERRHLGRTASADGDRRCRQSQGDRNSRKFRRCPGSAQVVVVFNRL